MRLLKQLELAGMGSGEKEGVPKEDPRSLPRCSLEEVGGEQSCPRAGQEPRLQPQGWKQSRGAGGQAGLGHPGILAQPESLLSTWGIT